MQNLYDIACLDAVNSDLGTQQKTAEAIKNKMDQITGKGILSYMNRPTTDLDLSKDFIVIDMLNVPELIKDAMNVLVQYFTNWIRKSSSFIPISKYFSVKCLKS